MKRAADARPERSWGQLSAGGVVVAAVVASTVLYPAAFGADVHPVGPDMFAYIWQTRLVGAATLAEIGTRPGMPVLGSVMSGFQGMTAGEAPLVLGLVLAIALGLTVGVALRLAFRLPSWSLGVATFTVALWGGTVSLSRGYLANELSLGCVAVAVLLVALPGKHARARMIGAFAATTAAGIAHPGFLPFYAAIVVVWLLLSLPLILNGRRSGHPWEDFASVRASVALAGAAGVTAVLIFGLMGFGVSDITNLTTETRDFSSRLTAMWGTIGLWKAVSILAVVGAVAAWRLRGPSSRDLTRAGLAWGLCSIGGGLATLANPSLPGPRALLVIVPLPAAAALGIVWVARISAGTSRRSAEDRAGLTPVAVSRVVAAAGLVIVLCAFVAAPGLFTLRRLGGERVRGEPARLVASYVATVVPDTPVVVLTSPAMEEGARWWRGRQDQVRAYVPRANIASTFVVVGELGGADGMTPKPVGRGGNEAFALGSEQSWVGGGPALRDRGAVVAPRALNNASVWDSISNDPTRIVAPDLAVLRGPPTVPRVSVPPAAVPSGAFVVKALASLLILAALGGGYGAAAARALEARLVDAGALAPALGVVLVVLTGLVVGLAGGDPRGLAGLTAVAGVSVVGYVVAWRTNRREQRSQSAQESIAAGSG